ncbi:MAG TPA: efflux RND transporter permease subunit, partial [Planctomycetaceae bacterium]|nr:efflux RND transporter permease subunit [Planctomycetaceae bacterium]
SDQAIDHPRIVLITTLLVLLAAGVAVVFIPVQRTPAISKAVILIAVPYPGAQPTEVEEQITRKIEEKLQRLSQVDFVSSTSMRGSSITQIIFLDGVDPDAARGEVKDLVDEVRRELPVARDVEPIVTDIDFENTPLMLVNLVPPDAYDERALKEIAEEIQDELETLPGVSSTRLFGGREREIHVNLDVDLAMQYGLALSDVRDALSASHAEVPGGELETGDFDYRVRSDSKFRSVNDIEQAVVREEEGRVIRVADVATVEDTYRRLLNVAHLNGKDCASLIVYKEQNTNTLKTANTVIARVEELAGEYPQLEFAVSRNSSAEISVMFRVLGSSFAFGAALVLIILSWSMGLRISLLVLTAIPFSSAVAIIFLYLFEVPVSNMVIFAFILVLGMVVDGAIIVAENIHRHIEMGKPPEVAAKDGIHEVGIPVIMADLTTISAYLPMLLVPGIMGDFMSVMPKGVTVALFGSILVDHFLIPVLAARWYCGRQGSENYEASTVVDSFRVVEFTKLGPLGRGYYHVLDWSLHNRLVILVCAVLSIVWAGFMLGNIGFQFFPASDRGQFEVKYELPLGTSLTQTIEAAKVITETLDELNETTGEVVNYVSAIGSSEGLASRLENDPAIGPEFGTVMVELYSPLDRDRHQDSVIEDVRRGIEKRIHRFPGMKYQIDEVEEGPPGGYPVAIRLTGKDHRLLGRAGSEIVDNISTIRGTLDVSTDARAENPEIVVEPNPFLTPFYGISHRQIAMALQTAVTGDNSLEISMDDEDVTLRLQVAAKYRSSLDGIQRMMIRSPNGKRATIGELADLRRTRGVHAVNRYERDRAVVAHCNLEGGVLPDVVFDELSEQILPALGFARAPQNPKVFFGQPGTRYEGVRATFTGENEERDENFSFLLMSMLIAVVMIFGILVLQFNSFRQAAVVIIAVPLSFAGVVGGMWLCQFPFSLATFIGLVSLSGIVVNDAIVVVDFINKACRRGLSNHDAILAAGVYRLRPVILTTVTTVGGLLPLFLNINGGAEFWQPLTGAVIFGLLFASCLTLLVIPVAFSLAYGGFAGAILDGIGGVFFFDPLRRQEDDVRQDSPYSSSSSKS